MGRTSICTRVLRLYSSERVLGARGLFRTFASAADRGSSARPPAILLVESPAKARKIQEFLGDNYRVLASYGHVRDLPAKAGSVDPSNGFEMKWEALQHSEKHIQSVQQAMREYEDGDAPVNLLLATDPDREGEAISWHVLDLLRERGYVSDGAENVQRITFTEITKDAVLGAISAPRKIDEKLVQAYLARRALDYLLGFHLSPILWRKLPGASSAGRVQSVALRMICEREDEIERFEQRTYWTVHGMIRLPDGSTVRAEVSNVDGTGYATLDEAEDVKSAIERVGQLTVKKISKKRISRQSQAPFTTSTLQQESNNKLGFGASKTMQLAQELYEGGVITYMRTDNNSMGAGAVESIRHVLKTKFGDEFVPSEPNVFTKKNPPNAQEAHEAVRPTDPLVTPQAVACRGYGSAAIKLYELIRNRALASQAERALSDNVAITFSAEQGERTDAMRMDIGIELKAKGSIVVFPGYLSVLGRSEDPSSVAEANFSSMSKLEEGQTVPIESIEAEEHVTKPPPRYTEGSLVKAMEDRGIGRPSTYAPTLKLLYARNYVKSSKKRLHAEPIGRILTSFLKQYAPEYVDYSYTSMLESEFDQISHGGKDWMEVMRQFWSEFQDTTEDLSRLSGTQVLDGLNEDLAAYLFRENAEIINIVGSDTAKHAAMKTNHSRDHRECPSCKGTLSLKLSHKGGPFIGCSQYPDCSYTRPLPSGDDDFVPTMVEDMGNAFKSMNIAEQYGMRGPVRLLGNQPGSNAMIFVRQGPYGPYIQVGLDKDPAMKRVPLPKDSKPRSLTLKYALSMLELPRTLGEHPETGAVVEVRNGKFGPFILHGGHMRSIPKDLDPLDLCLDDALKLLKLSSENKKLSPFSNVGDGGSGGGGGGGSKRKAAPRAEASVVPTPSAEMHIPSPPRARSAYQFFLKEYLSKKKMKNGKEKMKIMGQAWKTLSEEERNVFLVMAEDDLLRVRVQEASLVEPTLDAWESLDTDSKHAFRSQLASKGTASSGGATRPAKSKPTSAYTLFMQDVSEQMRRNKNKDEEANRGSFMTIVAKQWRSLTDEERAEYFDRAS